MAEMKVTIHTEEQVDRLVERLNKRLKFPPRIEVKVTTAGAVSRLSVLREIDKAVNAIAAEHSELEWTIVVGSA